VKSTKGGIEVVIPLLWRLVDSVEALKDLADPRFLARDDKTKRLSNIDLIIEGAIEKSRLDIHVQNIPTFLSY
jgi:hypothetical protein